MVQSFYILQLGISKQICLLEDELGVEVFVCSGKYLIWVMLVGEWIIYIVGEILCKVESIKQIVQEFFNEKKGMLFIVIIYIQVCYVLFNVISGFIKQYLDVFLYMYQGMLMQIVEMVVDGIVDFVIVIEVLELFGDLIMMFCYCWNCCVIVFYGYLLIKLLKLILEVLVEQLIVIYVFGFIGCFKFDEVFSQCGLVFKVVFIVVDVDVIKIYVWLGLGVGIVVYMVVDLKFDNDLVIFDVSYLFEFSVIKIGFCCGIFLCGFMCDFIEKFVLYLICELLVKVV